MGTRKSIHFQTSYQSEILDQNPPFLLGENGLVFLHMYDAKDNNQSQRLFSIKYLILSQSNYHL